MVIVSVNRKMVISNKVVVGRLKNWIIVLDMVVLSILLDDVLRLNIEYRDKRLVVDNRIRRKLLNCIMNSG